MTLLKVSTQLRAQPNRVLVVVLLLGLLATSWAGTAYAELPDLPKALSTANPTVKLTLLEFSAPWCVSCQVLKPELKKLAQEVGPKLRVVELDIEKSTNRQYIQTYEVYATPTLILFNRSGKALQKFENDINPKGLRQVILHYLAH